jgi:hypothetical protein
MSTSSSSERLAYVCIWTKKSKESPLLRLVFAHAEENRHAFVYEYVYILFFITIMLITVGVQKKRRKEEKNVKTEVNSP